MLDSCNADSLSPGPAGAADHPLLPPLAGRICGSFSPHDSDAQPSTSPAGSSGCGLRQRPPVDIRILKTPAGQLADKRQPMLQRTDLTDLRTRKVISFCSVSEYIYIFC